MDGHFFLDKEGPYKTLEALWNGERFSSSQDPRVLPPYFCVVFESFRPTSEQYYASGHICGAYIVLLTSARAACNFLHAVYE